MKKGWSLLVNGNPVQDVAQLVLFHPKFGALYYGKSPSGNYDQWSFHEIGGGGSVTVPFVLVEGALYIGTVSQPRPLQDTSGPVPNLPRGFLDPGESHFEAAKRETEEELGITATSFELPGEPTNPNSAFFETWGEGEGARFFGLEFGENMVKAKGEGYVLDEGLVSPVSKSAEGIMSAGFIPWQKAALVGDIFTIAGVARLTAYLESEGRLVISLA
ncbi:NUDIX domain-containing protein [Patescibacteria group bacterium]|nr:NUDIX domain-containing protein [Patescibacteria group bacterium]